MKDGEGYQILCFRCKEFLNIIWLRPRFNAGDITLILNMPRRRPFLIFRKIPLALIEILPAIRELSVIALTMQRKLRHKRFQIRHATLWLARVISRSSGHSAIPPHELIVMRIVRVSLLLHTRAPAEGSLALGTPHLVTAINLRNHGSARGARASLCHNSLDRFNCLRIADMLFSSNSLMALLADLG